MTIKTLVRLYVKLMLCTSLLERLLRFYLERKTYFETMRFQIFKLKFVHFILSSSAVIDLKDYSFIIAYFYSINHLLIMFIPRLVINLKFLCLDSMISL